MIKVFSGARGERGPIGTQVNLTLSEGASTDIADRPATAADGATWALLGDGVVTFFVWENGGWTNAGGFTDAAILGAGAKMYPSIADGVQATDNQGLFLVPLGPGTGIYQNVAGSAVQRGWIGELLYPDVEALVSSLDTGFEPGTILRTRREGVSHVVTPGSATDQHITTAGGTKLYETGLMFTSLERFADAVVRGETYAAGRIVAAGDALYYFADDGNTDISGLPGWRYIVAPDLETRMQELQDNLSPAEIALAVSEYLEGITAAKAAVAESEGAAAESAEEAKGYSEDAKGYSEDAKGHSEDVKGYSEDAKGYSEDAKGYSEDAKGSAEIAQNVKDEVCIKLEDAKVLVGKSELALERTEAARAVTEAARDAAVSGAEGVFRTIASGLAATSGGGRFLFAGTNGWSLYENNGGTENKLSGDFPSLTKLNELLADNIRSVAVAQNRPGERLEWFSDSRDGTRLSGNDPDGAVVTGLEPYGKVLDVGPAKIVATRDRYWLDTNKQLVVRGVFKVQNNTCDPQGEKVTLGVEWLDSNYVSIGNELLFDEVIWESDGWQNIERIINGTEKDLLFRSGINEPFDPNWDDERWLDEGGVLECPPELAEGETPPPDPGPYPDPFIVPPAGASYAVPYIQTHGNDGVTRIALLEGEPSASNISAERITYPLGFVFPKEVMPGEQIKRTIFVAQHGDNANNGRSLTRAVRDIEAARDLAAADDCVKYSIQVWPGEYVTQGHIDTPDNVSEIVGMSGQRAARVIPAAGFETRNVFRMGDGGMLRNISAEGWAVDNFDDPSEGFLISFRPGALILRALYVDHCVMYRGQAPVQIPLPLDPDNGNPNVPIGPGIALADGKVADPNSPFPQIMSEASTTSAPNGVGYVCKNNAFLNGINTISIWPHKHFMALGGGEILLNGCACQFGDFSLWSEGSMPQIKISVSPVSLVSDSGASSVVDANRQSIVDDMWSAVIAAGYGSVNEEFSRRDANNLVTALQYDLLQGRQESVEIFLQGLFPAGVSVAPSSLIPAFVAGWEGMKTSINGLAISAGAKATTDALIDLVIDTVQNPVFTVKTSYISAASHNWNFPFAGVNRRAFSRPTRQVPDTIVERSLGRVVYSGLDDKGKQYFTGGALVNPITGLFEGPPVDRTINPRAMRLALVAGGF